MFKNSHIISGLKSWESYSGKIINNKILTIQNMDDYYSYYSVKFRGPKKILSEYIKIKNCDQNFINKNIPPFLFQNTKILYLESLYPSRFAFSEGLKKFLKLSCISDLNKDSFLYWWHQSTDQNFIGVLNPTYCTFLNKYQRIYEKNQKWIVADENNLEKLIYLQKL